MKLIKRSTRPALTALAGLALGAAVLLGGCAGGAGDLGSEANRSSLPGFPSDAPVPADPIQTVILNDESQSHWSFTVLVKDAAAQEAVVKNYTGQGYKETGRSDYEGVTNVSLQKGTVAVTLTFDQDAEGQYRVIFNVVDQSGTVVPEVTIDSDGNVSGIDGDNPQPSPAEPDTDTATTGDTDAETPTGE